MRAPAANVQLNGISNIAIVEAAVADAGETAILHLADDRHSGHNTLGDNFAYDGVASGTDATVDIVAIDDFVRDRKLARVDVMKLDIEGKALTGSRDTVDRFRPIVIFEISPASLASENLVAYPRERRVESSDGNAAFDDSA
jgi:FkbM family methyltransferase